MMCNERERKHFYCHHFQPIISKTALQLQNKGHCICQKLLKCNFHKYVFTFICMHLADAFI